MEVLSLSIRALALARIDFVSGSLHHGTNLLFAVHTTACIIHFHAHSYSFIFPQIPLWVSGIWGPHHSHHPDDQDNPGLPAEEAQGQDWQDHQDHLLHPPVLLLAPGEVLQIRQQTGLHRGVYTGCV